MTRSLLLFCALFAVLLGLSGCGGGYVVLPPSGPVCGSREDVMNHQLFGVAAPACAYYGPRGFVGGPGVGIGVRVDIGGHHGYQNHGRQSGHHQGHHH